MATIQNPSLGRVDVFVRVVDTGSFTAAARALGVPKSSASRSVRHLETSLGVMLLQRTTRRLRLTDAGRAYYERAASALAGLEEARAAITDAQGEPRGLVRLAAPSEWGSWLLAPVIHAFRRRYPDVTLEIALTNHDVDLVRDGFDLALRFGRLNDSSLIVRQVGSVAGGLFASREYLARRGTPATLDDLANHDVIGYGKDGYRPRLTFEGPTGTVTQSFHSPVVSNDLGFVFEAVRLGMGIALLPVSGCVAHLGLVRVLPDYVKAGLACAVVYPSARHLPRRVALLRDALVDGLGARLQEPQGLGPPCIEAPPRPERSRAARRSVPRRVVERRRP